MTPEFKKRTLLKSFADSLAGIIYSLKNERNMRIHLVAALYVITFAAFLPLTRGEYACLFLSVGTVTAAECFNTAIENICDFNEKKLNLHIKIIKDISAGAVFICAVFAAAIGGVIFIRGETLELLRSIWSSPMLLVSIAAVSIAAVVFIVAGPLKIAAFFKKRVKPN